MKDTNTTTEFFVPARGWGLQPYIDAGDIDSVHHLARYHWACGVLPVNKVLRVLDIACGAGYGSAMLALALPLSTVLGSDYDERAIALARGQEYIANLEFELGDMATWKKGAESLGTFDVIVSFDTIEHLLHREIALLRISDNLTDDGTLLVSTPSSRDETLLNPAWEHHKIEYSHKDLIPLLKRFFQVVLTPQDTDFPNASYWQELNRNQVIYPNLGNPLVCRRPVRTSACLQAT